MSTDLLERLAGWDSVQHAVGEIRAGGQEFDRFFAEVFDQLDSLSSQLVDRQQQWQSQCQQAESQFQQQTEHLAEEQAAWSAQKEQLEEAGKSQRDQEAAAASQFNQQLQQLLEDARQERTEFRDAQEAVHGKLDQLAAMTGELAEAQRESGAKTGDEKLEQTLEGIRQEQAELRGAQEAVHGKLDQLTNVAAALANTQTDLTDAQKESIAKVGNAKLEQMLEGIRQEQAELRGAQETVHGKLDQLATAAAGLAEAQKDSGAKVGDEKLEQMLEGVRQEQAELRGAQEAVHGKLDQLAAAAAELTDAQKESFAKPGDEKLEQMLEGIRQEQAELRGAQEAVHGKLDQLAAAAAELAQAQEKSTAADGEDKQLLQLIEDTRQQQTQLEQERAVLETELEAVRNRAAEMAESLAEQKRQATQQQTQWNDELKRMRCLLEEMSGQMARGEPAAEPRPAKPEKKKKKAAAAGPAPTMTDPALDSVMAQFEMLQKDLAKRRAASS